MGLNEVPALPSIWNVPYRRNPFFTGREDVLKHLYDTLASGKTAALTQPQAISGLGGIGKTQTAVEYAYRYGGEYQAVLWAKADSREALISDFVSIAGLLDLPQKNEQDQNLVVNAVKYWLQSNNDWLLIFDNVEDWDVVSDFIPTGGRGHILLTTRAQATGTIAQSIEIEKMTTKEGALFLLRRAKLIDSASEEDHVKAKEISEIMDGLPLALDQAGAYVEETKCGLSRYLDLYQERRVELLKRRGRFVSGHLDSVTTTFSLSFEKVQQVNPAANELLRLCAFLHPDDIPEEIITEGTPELGTVLQPAAADLFLLDEAIGELLKYSLVRRNAETQTLSIHRLVQAVTKDGMEEDMQQQWAERTVKVVYHAYPHVEFATWRQCQRCILHAQECAKHIEQWNIMFTEAALLLHGAASYLQDHAQYTEAEHLCIQAQSIFEQTSGLMHFDMAISLHNLASIYHIQGKYDLAESIYQKALMTGEQALGSDHIGIALILNGLASLYHAQGKYIQAEPLHLRSLNIRKKKLGLTHPDTATSLNNLGLLYYAQGRYSLAESMYKQVLEIIVETLEPNHPHIATCINNLAELYRTRKKYAQAEPLYHQTIAIREQSLGPNHPDLAQSLNNLGLLYYMQGKYAQAEPLYHQAIAIREQSLGPNHPDLAQSLNNLAELYRVQGKYTQAETLHQRTLTIRKRSLGTIHPDVTESQNNLALLYYNQGQYAQAESLYKQAILSCELSPGCKRIHLEIVQKNYDVLLWKMNQKAGAMASTLGTKLVRSKRIKKCRKRRRK